MMKKKLNMFTHSPFITNIPKVYRRCIQFYICIADWIIYIKEISKKLLVSSIFILTPMYYVNYEYAYIPHYYIILALNLLNILSLFTIYLNVIFSENNSTRYNFLLQLRSNIKHFTGNIMLSIRLVIFTIFISFFVRIIFNLGLDDFFFSFYLVNSTTLLIRFIVISFWWYKFNSSINKSALTPIWLTVSTMDYKTPVLCFVFFTVGFFFKNYIFMLTIFSIDFNKLFGFDFNKLNSANKYFINNINKKPLLFGPGITVTLAFIANPVHTRIYPAHSDCEYNRAININTLQAANYTYIPEERKYVIKNEKYIPIGHNLITDESHLWTCQADMHKDLLRYHVVDYSTIDTNYPDFRNFSNLAHLLTNSTSTGGTYYNASKNIISSFLTIDHSNKNSNYIVSKNRHDVPYVIVSHNKNITHFPTNQLNTTLAHIAKMDNVSTLPFIVILTGNDVYFFTLHSGMHTQLRYCTNIKADGVVGLCATNTGIAPIRPIDSYWPSYVRYDLSKIEGKKGAYTLFKFISVSDLGVNFILTPDNNNITMAGSIAENRCTNIDQNNCINALGKIKQTTTVLGIQNQCSFLGSAHGLTPVINRP